MLWEEGGECQRTWTPAQHGEKEAQRHAKPASEGRCPGLNPGSPRAPGSDFKVLPGKGALSGEVTDFVPGVFRKWWSRKGRRKGAVCWEELPFPILLVCVPNRAGAPAARQHMGGRWKGA